MLLLGVAFSLLLKYLLTWVRSEFFIFGMIVLSLVFRSIGHFHFSLTQQKSLIDNPVIIC